MHYLTIINLFFKEYNPHGEMYFLINIYYKFLMIIIYGFYEQINILLNYY